jgi:hypothetical protein
MGEAVIKVKNIIRMPDVPGWGGVVFVVSQDGDVYEVMDFSRTARETPGLLLKKVSITEYVAEKEKTP